MSATRLAHFALLPELELIKTQSAGPGTLHFVVRKTSEFEVCPRCASKCHTTYDRRRVRVFDAPLRNKKVLLEISKRRFLCKSCCKVFMEPVAGISKGSRFTQRMKAHILWCCASAQEIAEFYSYRWNVQLDIRSIKTHLNM